MISCIAVCIPAFAQYIWPSLLETNKEQIYFEHQNYVSGEIIVKFKPSKMNLKSSAGMRSMSTFASVQWMKIKDQLLDNNITVFTIDTQEDVFQKIQQLYVDPNVEYAQPNFIYRSQIYQPNDPWFREQWGLYNTWQTILWSVGASGADIKRTQAMNIRSWGVAILTTWTIVAVIDDGVQYVHPDLSGQFRDGTNCVSNTWSPLGWCIFGYDFFAMDKDPLSYGNDTHGTHIAGIIWAKPNNSIGVAWVNPWSKIMALRVASWDVLTTSVVVKAIAFAKYNGAKIINASRWGEQSWCSYYDTALYTAIKNFPWLVIVAAGNESTEHTWTYYFYPADFNKTTICWSGLDNIIAVAASTNIDTLASFSDYGLNIQIAAPGQKILSTVYASQYGYMDGTSMAVPFVAGVASLARSFRPDLSYIEIKQVLLDSAKQISALSGYVASWRRLDAYTTLYALDNYSPSLPTLLTPGSGSDMGTWLVGFTWTASEDVWVGMSGYYIQISTGNDFANTLTWVYVYTTWYTISIATTGEYYRRVYAFDHKYNTGDWSTVSSFSITYTPDTIPPPIPTLMVPSVFSSHPRGNISFVWTPSVDTWVGTMGYLYEVLSGAMTISWTTSTTWATIHLDSWEYTRRVKAYDNNFNYSDFSSPVSFSVLRDITPETVQIDAITNTEPNTLYTSNIVTLSGINTGILISVNTWLYKLNSNWRTWVASTWYQGDTIQLALTSAVNFSTAKSMTLVYGDKNTTFTVTTKAAPPPPPSPGGWPPPTPSIPSCTSLHLICSGWVYILNPWSECQWGSLWLSCTVTWEQNSPLITNTIWSIGNIVGSPFVQELNDAYLYAYTIGITTMPTIQEANMTGTLIRKHLAKMISNFAMQTLNIVPNTGKICIFEDVSSESMEMKRYTKLACQLWLMGLDAQGIPMSIFNPNEEVTRAQFGTVLSRVLRGDTYNGSTPFYVEHLNALQKAKIMKQISTPGSKELRGFVMLMLMRTKQ